MAFFARNSIDDYALPEVKSRIIGGRLVTTVELPKQTAQPLPKFVDKVNHHHPGQWEKNLHAAVNGNCGCRPGNCCCHPTPPGPPATVLPPPGPDHHLVLDLFNMMQAEHRDGALPRRTLKLTEQQQVALIYEIDRTLRGHTNPEVLKSCYLELTTFDRQLSGAVQYNDLVFILNKNKVILPPVLLRLIASLFVVPQFQAESKVHYEKFLSFLGACFRRLAENQGTPRGDMITAYQMAGGPAVELVGDKPWQLQSVERLEEAQTHANGTSRHSDDPPDHVAYVQRVQETPRASVPPKMYYEQPNSVRTHEIPVERDISRTKRIAEECLRTSNRMMRPQDFEALRASFLRADRLVRRALSEGHIKDICHQHNFPLPDQVLEEIIRTCCTHRGGGQYDWEQFIDFIEKLQPVNTGLQIGGGPRPTGRRPPSPVASWPHAESPVPPEMMMDASCQSDAPGAPLQFYPAPAQQPGVHPNEVLKQIRQQLHDSKGREWLQNFEHFARVLYDADDTRTGLLRQPEVLLQTKRWNDRLRLYFSELDIDDALRRARMSDGRIDINLYLKTLTRTNPKAYETVTLTRPVYH